MPGLASLPAELLRYIALHLYNPLEITQQDQLTWGIFSTVDMDPARQQGLLSLVSFGSTFRAARSQVRVILFRCIRVTTMDQLETIVDNMDNWAQFVNSIIIDLTLFDEAITYKSSEPGMGRRSCYKESALLTSMFNNLPRLEHVCFFADSTDDATLALVIRDLVSQTSASSASEPRVHNPSAGPSRPFATRLRSLSWRQRQRPPTGYRSFSTNGLFMSLNYLLSRAINLEYLVLDAAMDDMTTQDIKAVMNELLLRDPSAQNPIPKLDLTLCGPIKSWNYILIKRLIPSFQAGGLKGLYIDRPVNMGILYDGMESIFESYLSPLLEIDSLGVFQMGSYRIDEKRQRDISIRVSKAQPNLKVLGLWGLDGDTNWWAFWRKPSKHVTPPVEFVYRDEHVGIAPLADGHLQWLL